MKPEETKAVIVVVILIAVLSSASFAIGKTVQLNLALAIGSKDDNITVGSSHVSAQDENVTLSIVSGGTALGTGNITAYSSTEYMLQVTQAAENNRFLVSFTNGTNQTIINKLNSLGSRKILPRTFGGLVSKIPENFMVFLRLEYDDIDIISRTRWSANPVRLLISNEGANDRGVTQVSITIVK